MSRPVRTARLDGAHEIAHQLIHAAIEGAAAGQLGTTVLFPSRAEHLLRPHLGDPFMMKAITTLLAAQAAGAFVGIAHDLKQDPHAIADLFARAAAG